MSQTADQMSQSATSAAQNTASTMQSAMSDGDAIFTAPHLRWGVIGCGVIANQMAEALASVGRTIDGVANRTQEKAVAFAQKHHVKRVYDSIDDLLAGIERACKGLSQARGYDVQDEVIANAATLFGA